MSSASDHQLPCGCVSDVALRSCPVHGPRPGRPRKKPLPPRVVDVPPGATILPGGFVRDAKSGGYKRTLLIVEDGA